MKDAKFNMNAVVLIVIIFSAIGLFFTIKLPTMANMEAVNEFWPVEGTEVSVKNSNRETNGLYTGTKFDGTLRLAGEFGYDWGAYAEGRTLYINEYLTTTMGMTVIQLDRVDLDTYKKEVFIKDAILRGRTASGELVVVTGFIIPSTFPDTNSLMSAYSAASNDIRHDGMEEIRFIDPRTGETVYTQLIAKDAEAEILPMFEKLTLDDIKKGA